MAARRGLKLDIKAPPRGVSAFTPLWSLYKIRSTRLPSSGAGDGCRAATRATEASATAWLEVAAVGYLAWHLR